MKIVITGAISGIGRQLAIDYLAEGHEVWALGRNEQALNELRSRGLSTGRVDLTDRDAALAWFSALESADLAILNAGTCEYIDLPDFQLLNRTQEDSGEKAFANPRNLEVTSDLQRCLKHIKHQAVSPLDCQLTLSTVWLSLDHNTVVCNLPLHEAYNMVNMQLHVSSIFMYQTLPVC